MCGIVGLVSRRGRRDVRTLIDLGVKSLSHRGPDSQGTWITSVGDWDIALGHTRLSIIDLSEAGRQPMRSASGKLTITFNGEIYNYGELRHELAPSYPFRGHSDTETILAGSELHGFDFVKRLRGMYAYAVWDSRIDVLRLARDPFGIKPLYYFSSEDCFVFASEIRTVMRLCGDLRRLNHSAVTTFLETGSCGEIQSMVDGILSVPAGQELIVNVSREKLIARSVNAAPVWASPTTIPKRREDAVIELGNVIRDSVRKHLVSDVPVGLFLSGGIDSGALLALMRDVAADEIQTFTVSFGKSALSEGIQAREMAQLYGCDHHEVVLSEERLLSELPTVLGVMDQPSGDGVNSYVVSQAVRSSGLKVALSGLGGDEIFCGYPSFRRQVALSRYARVGAFTSTVVSALRNAIGFRDVRWEKMADFLKTGGRPEGVYDISRRMFPSRDVERLFGRAFHEDIAMKDSPDDAINAISFLEISNYMRNTLLRDSDVMSMAHALEVRVPFVDVEVCRFVLAMPGAWKLSDNRPKSVLLDALGGRLPESVWRRKKMGFTLPFEEWMVGRLNAEISATFSDDALLESCGLSPSAVRGIWNEFLLNSQRWRWSRPWSLFVFAKWCKQHGVTI